MKPVPYGSSAIDLNSTHRELVDFNRLHLQSIMHPEKTHRNFSPLELEIILHAQCSPEPIKNHEATAVIESINMLESIGLIEMRMGDASFTYRTTEAGKAFVALLCMTPLPEQVWASNGKIISFL